jgi:hypothetical protein
MQFLSPLIGPHIKVVGPSRKLSFVGFPARAPRRDHTRPGRQDAGRPDTQSSVGGPLRRRNAGRDVGGDGRSSR